MRNRVGRDDTSWTLIGSSLSIVNARMVGQTLNLAGWRCLCYPQKMACYPMKKTLTNPSSR